MNYQHKKYAHHAKVADVYERKASEHREKGNKLKAAHFMRLAYNHLRNAKFQNKDNPQRESRLLHLPI